MCTKNSFFFFKLKIFNSIIKSKQNYFSNQINFQKFIEFCNSIIKPKQNHFSNQINFQKPKF